MDSASSGPIRYPAGGATPLLAVAGGAVAAAGFCPDCACPRAGTSPAITNTASIRPENEYLAKTFVVIRSIRLRLLAPYRPMPVPRQDIFPTLRGVRDHLCKDAASIRHLSSGRVRSLYG